MSWDRRESTADGRLGARLARVVARQSDERSPPGGSFLADRSPAWVNALIITADVPVSGRGYGSRVLTRLHAWRPVAWRPALDVALALTFIAAGQATAWTATAGEGPKEVIVPVAFVVAAALAWRRQAPLGSLIVVLGAAIVLETFARSPASIYFLVVLLISVFSTAAHLPSKRAAWAGALALVCVEVVDLLDRTATSSDKVFTALVLVGAPWLAGRALRHQRDRSTELSALSDQLRVERDERARAAVAAERVRSRATCTT